MDFKSKLLNDAVEQMSSLPGIGKRSALRLVLHLLDQSEKEVKDFIKAFEKFLWMNTIMISNSTPNDRNRLYNYLSEMFKVVLACDIKN